MKHRMQCKTHFLTSGFTLVEMSIVLVIIGLVIGGIITGKTLIRSANVKAIISDYQTYQSAINAFTLKFDALPGDMPNASDIWGAADGGDGLGADCYNVDSTGNTSTCNGNGNLVIGGLPFLHETFRAWQHLANAELIAGSFSGRSGPGGGNHAVENFNSPSSSLTNSGFSFKSISGVWGDANWFQNRYENMIVYGRYSTTEWETLGRILTGSETWLIDKKIDDGYPAKGKIWAFHWSLCTTASSNTDYSAEYNITTTENSCALLFFSL